MSNENDERLAVWFTPRAIREHFEDDESPFAEWVASATDEQLAMVGEMCLGSDSLWQLFHELLTEIVEEQIATPSTTP